jgi:hypothetical protein
MTDAEHFEKHGCLLVKNFIDEQTVAVVSQYFENKIRRGEWFEISEGDDPTSRFAYYADPLIEVLLQASKEAVEEATGKELLPTYSYSRIYQPGESLRPHVDRPSCEVSVTVNVATKGEFSPVYTQYGQNDPEKHVLNPGDAVVYMGCEVLHWRRPLKDGQLNVQFMLHYVDKNGPNAEFVKDKRQAYGFPVNKRSK